MADVKPTRELSEDARRSYEEVADYFAMKEKHAMTSNVEHARSRWFRKLIDWCGRTAFIVGAIVLYTKITAPTQQPDKKLSIHVSRSAGANSLASRCSDCSQPGDTYTVVLWGGESGSLTSIYTFVNDRYVTSCDDCRAMSFIVHDIGRFYVVGSSRPQHCQINTISLDALIASAMNCGSVEYSSFDVR